MAKPDLRIYPAAVSVARRASRGPASAGDTTSFADIEAWLLGAAMAENDLLAMIESLAWRLRAAGFQLDRLTVHVGTLHPQLIGFMWAWYLADGICDEARVARATLESASYLSNPLVRVIEHGETVRLDPNDGESAARYPLMADLQKLGLVDYVAMPFRTGGLVHASRPFDEVSALHVASYGDGVVRPRQYNAATIATSDADGFSDEDLRTVERILRIFALHLERHIAMRVASNLVDTYIGPVAGGEVLHGTIRRGDGASINAIIWASDLRDFTGLTQRLSAEDVASVLNAAFERLVGSVGDHCGEVLKFIGDGLLAVFRYDSETTKRAAAEAALMAARHAIRELDELNARPPADLAMIEGWAPLRAGIALHDGEVFFGNVGGAERLDFTVIGRAVNEASRVEGLTKTLGRPVLVTEDVARYLDDGLEDLGEHTLRGLDRAIRVYGLAAD